MDNQTLWSSLGADNLLLEKLLSTRNFYIIGALLVFVIIVVRIPSLVLFAKQYETDRLL